MWRIGFVRLDEEILGEANGLALIEGGDVVAAVLGHADRAGVVVRAIRSGRELDLLAIVENEQSIAQRAVGEDFEIGDGAFDCVQIAAMLVDRAA